MVRMLWKPRSVAKYSRHRVIYLTFFIILGLILLYIHAYQNNTWNLLNTENSANSGGFLVNTPGCRIPDLPTWSRNIEPYTRNQYTEPKCSQKWYSMSNSKKQRGPALIDSNLTTIWLVHSALPHYNIYDVKHVNCCYRSFWRIQEDLQNYSMNADNYASYSNYCRPFTGDYVVVEKDTEFVKVECTRLHYYYDSNVQNRSDFDDQNVKIYNDYHAFVPVKDSVEKRCSKHQFTHDKLSVLVIGIDSVSRLNMLRQLPKTYEILTSPPLSAISLLGYNKVGDNTFPNIVPLLTGYSEDELVSICWPTRKKKFDSCPFIWKDFAANGFRTAYGEDSTTISTFNYKKVGFIEEPTDYYVRPYFYESLKQLGHVGKTDLKLCTGPRQSFEYFVSYVKKYAIRFSNDPYFGFFWSNIISHSNMNMPHIGDHNLATMLQELIFSGALNRSVLILMSDHGIRWGKFRETQQGRLEERLPFFFISFPNWFQKQYSMAMENLKINTQNRLTTPFDVHLTLLDLLYPKERLTSDCLKARSIEVLSHCNLKWKKMNENVFSSSYVNKSMRGISLFLPISPSRTCDMAGISQHWCTCQTNSPVSTKDPVILNVANFIINTLNVKLSDYSNCERLQLRDIKYAEKRYTYSELTPEKFPFLLGYLIIIVTKPGGAIFETSIRLNLSNGDNVNASFALAGPISRLNSYGNESSCVDDSTIQLYCYCKMKIT